MRAEALNMAITSVEGSLSDARRWEEKAEQVLVDARDTWQKARRQALDAHQAVADLEDALGDLRALSEPETAAQGPEEPVGVPQGVETMGASVGDWIELPADEQ